jgi:transposase InsO family protein
LHTAVVAGHRDVRSTGAQGVATHEARPLLPCKRVLPCRELPRIDYLAFIIDVFSRRLVGWKAARTMRAALVLDALNMAAWTRRCSSLDGLICHMSAFK